MRLILWCNRLIKWGFYLLFGLVPLLLTPWNYELFEYNKMMAVYIVASLVVTSWFVKSIAQKEFRFAKTPLDIPIGLFVGSSLLSALFSIDPHVSWFGYYSRFNGGMWSVISYVLLYYAFLSNIDVIGIKTTRYHILRVALITATIVAIYAVLERLGIDKHLWVQDVQNRVFSTLGQPNWLAAYLVTLMPIAWALELRTQIPELKSQQGKKFLWSLGSVFWVLISILFFLALLFTRSRSGLLGFVVADLTFWALIVMRSVKSWKKIQTLVPSIKKPLIILHVIFVLIVFINGTGSPAFDTWITFNGWKNLVQRTTGKALQRLEATPSAAMAGPALEVGGTESGTIRKYVWQGAVNAWNSSAKTRLIGTGTETFAFAFYEFRPTGHNLTSEWDFLYNKAHNEYLNYLATTGLLGLGSYLALIGTFIWWFIRDLKTKNENLTSESTFEILALRCAIFSGWLSILITNFFGFSVVVTQLFLFLFPAMIFALSPQFTIQYSQFKRDFPFWTIWLLAIGGLYVFIRVSSFWYADTLYAKGYRLIRAGLYGQAIPAFTSAIALNPAEPTYHDELASGYATLAVAAFEGKNATQAAQLATLAIEESTKAIQTSPRNVNFYKTRTKVYYTLSSLEPTFNAKAVEALEGAIPFSPNDPKIYYNLAILVGREGETDQAIEYLIKAKELKSNYRDAYFALWVFYTEEQKPNEAKAILQEYLENVDPNDKDFQERIK